MGKVIDRSLAVRVLLAVAFAGALPLLLAGSTMSESIKNDSNSGLLTGLFGICIPIVSSLLYVYASVDSVERMRRPWHKLSATMLVAWLGCMLGVIGAGLHEQARPGTAWVIDEHTVTTDGFYRFAMRHRVERVLIAWNQSFDRLVVTARTSDGVTIECEVTGTSYITLSKQTVAQGGRLNRVNHTATQAWLVAGIQAAVATCQYENLTPDRCSRLSLEASQIAFGETRQTVPFADVRWSLDIRNVRPVVST